MASKLPYNSLPNLGELQAGDVVPMLRPPFQEGSAFVSDVQKYVRPYDVYTALLSQSGTDDPTAIILENSIGAIVWTRDDIGIYLGTLVGAFTENKTFVLQNWGSGNYCIINSMRGTDDYILINSNELSSPNDPIDVNGMMQIEIRVYYSEPA